MSSSSINQRLPGGPLPPDKGRLVTELTVAYSWCLVSLDRREFCIQADIVGNSSPRLAADKQMTPHGPPIIVIKQR